MMTQFRTFLFLGLISICGVVSAEEELPTLRELYQSYIAANGGLNNLRSVNSVQIFATVTEVSGETLDMKSLVKRPAKVRNSMEFPNYTVDQAYNGKEGWMRVRPKNGEAQFLELESEALQSLIQSASIEGAFARVGTREDWVKVAAFESVKGKPAVRLEIDAKADCMYDTIWLSLDHFLELKLQRTFSTAEGEKIETSYFSEFEQRDGLWLSFATELYTDGVLSRTVKAREIRINPGVFDSWFDKPEW